MKKIQNKFRILFNALLTTIMRAFDFPQEGNDTLHVILNDTSDIYAFDTVHMAFTDMEKERESEWETLYSANIDFQLKKNDQ